MATFGVDYGRLQRYHYKVILVQYSGITLRQRQK
jgi:hypothetical protein